MSTTAAERRRKQLAGIHVLASRLGLDDTTYRDLLERVTGVRSAAKLDARGRGRVLSELRRLSGEREHHMRRAVPPPGGPENVREELAAMIAKVGAILADTGRSWAYAHGLAKKMFKVEKIEWLTAEQLHRVVAALSIHQNRKQRHA